MSSCSRRVQDRGDGDECASERGGWSAHSTPVFVPLEIIHPVIFRRTFSAAFVGMAGIEACLKALAVVHTLKLDEVVSTLSLICYCVRNAQIATSMDSQVQSSWMRHSEKLFGSEALAKHHPK